MPRIGLTSRAFFGFITSLKAMKKNGAVENCAETGQNER